MENAADALKIAFAIFVFVVAITIVFTMVSKAKSTADTVLYYTDETNFYDHADSKDENREVYTSDVISTLYRYYNESVSVTVKLKDTSEVKDGIYIFDLGYETVLIKNNKGETLKSISTKENIEENLKLFIKESKFASLSESTKFTEEFVEVPTRGIYMTGSDGSEITLSSGGKKVYVTYTQI